MGTTIAPQDEAERDLRFWCLQTIGCAMTVRAHELGKTGVTTDYMREAATTAQEVRDRIFEEVGPLRNHAHQTAWMVDVAQRTFAWVNDHLDRAGE